MGKLKKLQLDGIALATEETKLILGGGGDETDGGDNYGECTQSCQDGCKTICKAGRIYGK